MTILRTQNCLPKVYLLLCVVSLHPGIEVSPPWLRWSDPDDIQVQEAEAARSAQPPSRASSAVACTTTTPPQWHLPVWLSTPTTTTAQPLHRPPGPSHTAQTRTYTPYKTTPAAYSLVTRGAHLCVAHSLPPPAPAATRARWPRRFAVSAPQKISRQQANKQPSSQPI